METDEALRRIAGILPMLREDVRTAIKSHTAMDATNTIVGSQVARLRTPFVNTYSDVQTSLVLKLAMDLARIFDWTKGAALKRQNMASIPVLAALLERPDVQEELERSAAGWRPEATRLGTVGDAPVGAVESALRAISSKRQTEDRFDFRAALTDFFAAVERLNAEGAPAKGALQRLRDFRTKRLAHALFDNQPDPWPTYSDLDLLLKVAVDAVTSASLAIEGLHESLDERVALDRTNAEGFARCLLDGLSRSSTPISSSSQRQYVAAITDDGSPASSAEESK